MEEKKCEFCGLPIAEGTYCDGCLSNIRIVVDGAIKSLCEGKGYDGRKYNIVTAFEMFDYAVEHEIV